MHKITFDAVEYSPVLMTMSHWVHAMNSLKVLFQLWMVLWFYCGFWIDAELKRFSSVGFSMRKFDQYQNQYLFILHGNSNGQTSDAMMENKQLSNVRCERHSNHGSQQRLKFFVNSHDKIIATNFISNYGKQLKNFKNFNRTEFLTRWMKISLK